MKQLPKGFFASGVRVGIDRNRTKPDLAVFFSDRPCRAAGIFTTNRIKAAPVLVSRSHIRRGKVRAIIANSGCANACTGDRGFRDAETMAVLAAGHLSGLNGSRAAKEDVLVASTGIIGEYLPMDRVERGIKNIARKVMRSGRSGASCLSAVRAIMTTDTVPKVSARVLKERGKTYTIWGCAKGSGMIHPNMATMLSFILTDADLPARLLGRSLKTAADRSFNALTVDGDTSTNDCVFLLANGMSGARPTGGSGLRNFQSGLESVCQDLAEQMVADGEGATRSMTVTVKGARSVREARKVAETVATSSLVKTALYGRDANWGRIMAAAGRAGVALDPDRIGIAFGPLRVVRNGCAIGFSEKRARSILSRKVVPITIDLRHGTSEARYLTCDLSHDYVSINADYRT